MYYLNQIINSYFSLSLSDEKIVYVYCHEEIIRENRPKEYRDIILPSGRFVPYLEEELLVECKLTKAEGVFVCDYYYLYYGPLLEIGTFIKVEIDHLEFEHTFTFFRCSSNPNREISAEVKDLKPIKKILRLSEKEYRKIEKAHTFLLEQISVIDESNFPLVTVDLNPRRN